MTYALGILSMTAVPYKWPPWRHECNGSLRPGEFHGGRLRTFRVVPREVLLCEECACRGTAHAIEPVGDDGGETPHEPQTP